MKHEEIDGPSGPEINETRFFTPQTLVWKIDQALAVANRGTLPQKWPDPPRMWPVCVNCPE